MSLFDFFLKVGFSVLLALIFWELFVSAFVLNLPDVEFKYGNFLPQIGSKSLYSDEGYSRHSYLNDFGTYYPINFSKSIIIYMGDSFTLGSQVASNKNYVSILHNSILEYEHLNVGNVGSSMSNYYYNYVF